jgi:hypothetical protein
MARLTDVAAALEGANIASQTVADASVKITDSCGTLVMDIVSQKT